MFRTFLFCFLTFLFILSLFSRLAVCFRARISFRQFTSLIKHDMNMQVKTAQESPSWTISFSVWTPLHMRLVDLNEPLQCQEKGHISSFFCRWHISVNQGHSPWFSTLDICKYEFTIYIYIYAIFSLLFIFSTKISSEAAE